MLHLNDDCIQSVIRACDTASLPHLASVCQYLHNLSRPRLAVEYVRKLHRMYLLAKRKHARQLSKARQLGKLHSHQTVLCLHPKKGLIPYCQASLRNELLRVREYAFDACKRATAAAAE